MSAKDNFTNSSVLLLLKLQTTLSYRNVLSFHFFLCPCNIFACCLVPYIEWAHCDFIFYFMCLPNNCYATRRCRSLLLFILLPQETEKIYLYSICIAYCILKLIFDNYDNFPGLCLDKIFQVWVEYSRICLFQIKINGIYIPFYYPSAERVIVFLIHEKHCRGVTPFPTTALVSSNFAFPIRGRFDVFLNLDKP